MVENTIIPNTDENAERCVCPECPTYTTCMNDKNEYLFCSRGISECDIKKKGCNCPTCPVWRDYGLNDFFYCENKAEK
jgi:hypothetical protein